jgi:hypothetical protein
MACAATCLLSACHTPPSGEHAPASPSFARDVRPVLEKGCATAHGCHGPRPSEVGDLNLRGAAAYAELVDTPAALRPSEKRVARGAPERSFLLEKLQGTLGPDEGKRMPLDPATHRPLDDDGLPPGFVDHVLIPWIRAGAPNN